MDDNLFDEYEKLWKHYKKANMIAYSSPDQFQYRQNQLLKCIAKFILKPFLLLKKFQNENEIDPTQRRRTNKEK